MALKFDNNDVESLEPVIVTILQKHPQGISEYDLLKQLQNLENSAFKHLEFSSHATLFQAHFLLFHILYRIRDKLFESENILLDINAINITLHTVEQSADQAISVTDPLRDYYLNLSNLFDTSEQDVIDLIASFWTRLHSTEQREYALAELGLQDPVDFLAIKQQYRKLAMEHHPDRGGDTHKLQIINAAMEILERSYNGK